MSERQLPRGIEVLVKKAAVDAAFRELLLERRSGAAKEIALDLAPAEAAMLDCLPRAQLEAIVARTKVDAKERPAFLGKAAAVMIAALGVGGSSCNRLPAIMRGYPLHRPARPPVESQGERQGEAQGQKQSRIRDAGQDTGQE